MFKFNKKGTEKPIEIFIALFIILAVSMVMLKMFQSQIKSKTADMQEYDQETALEQARDEATNICKTECTRANDNGCSLRAKAAYCIKKLDSLDLNGDLQTGGYDENLMGGIGVCEDAILCPHVQTCTCGVELNIAECSKVLCDHFTGNLDLDAGGTGNGAADKVLEVWNPGSCNTSSSSMWTKVYTFGSGTSKGISNIIC